MLVTSTWKQYLIYYYT